MGLHRKISTEIILLMNETGKKLISHGSIYFAGNILRHVVSFIMLPIYTRVLTPADYGTIELLSMVIDFASILFGLRIGEAIFRFYLMAESYEEKNHIISSALILAALLNSVGFFILFATSGLLSTAIFGGVEQQNLLVLFSLSLLFAPIVEIPMTYIRAQQRPWLFISFSIVKLTLQLSLNIYWVVTLGLGVKGVILSAVVSSGVMAVLLGVYCLHNTGLRFSFSRAKDLITFSYPMILASIIGFYVTFGDRYFLNLFGTLTDVGIYALGYKFGFLLTFIGIGPFLSIWDSERYHVLNEPNARCTFQKVFVLFTMFILLIAVGISIFSRNILMVMANPEFWGAALIVPVVVLAYFFQGLMSYCNLGIIIHKKTIIFTKSAILAAVVITVLYFLLIPSFGASGAAWATVLANMVKFFYINHYATNLYDMELPWKKMFVPFFLSVSAVVVSLFGPNHIIWSISVNVLILYSLTFIFTLLSVLPTNQRIILRAVLLSPWSLPQQMRSLLRNT